MEVLLAITGASGSIYAASLLAALSQRGVNVDLVLTPAAQIVIRQELNWDLEGSSEVIQEKLVHYLCLLYTSPSPRDRQKSRMPSSA